MSTKVGQLTIEMAANVARLEKDMAQARRSVETTMSKIQRSADSAMRSLGALGIGLSVGAFATWIKGAIDAADALNDISAATGIAAQQLAGLDYAAKISGTTLQAVTDASNKMQLSLTTNTAAMQRLGITVEDPVEALKQLADLYVSAEGQANKAAIANSALGRSWQSVAGFLGQGSEGIQALIDEGMELSGVTQKVLDDAGRFNDELDRLSVRSQALALNIAGPLLSAISSFIDELNAGVEAAGGFWKAIGLLGTTNPFSTLENQVQKYKKEVEDLTAKQTKYGELASIAFGVNEKLAQATQRLAYFEQMLAIETRKASEARAEGSSGANAHTIAYNAMITSADELVAKMEEEFSLIGLTNEQRAVSIAMRKLEELGIRSGTEAFEKYLKEIIEIQRRIGIKKQMVQLADDAARAAKRETEEYDRLITTLKEKIATIEMENQTFGLTNRERERSIFLRELENVKIQDRNALIEKYDEATLIKEVNDLREKSTKERLEKEKDYAKEVEKINDQIGQSLTDALMQGGVNAKDFLLNMFRTMVLRPMLQPIITGFVGAFTSSAMAGATGGAEEGATGGTVGTSLGLVGMASSLKSAYQMVTGGFASLGATVTSAVEGLGASLILENAPGSVLSSMGQSLASSASALGTIASYGAGIGAGLGVGNLISGGKGIGGGSSWLTVGGGTAIGAMVGGPLGAAIGGIVGGLANAAFGTGKKEIDDSGLQIRFNSMRTTIDAYEEWSKSGGWFSGGDDGVDISAVDAGVQKYFDAAVASAAISVKQYADILGISADGISSFAFEVKQSLKDLTPEEAQKAIDKTIAAYGNALAANTTPQIGAVMREGEEAGTALTRLATSLNAVNTVFDTLNIKLMETSVFGADAASKLIDLFGGIDGFVKSTDYYYQNFYSTQERIGKTTEQLTRVFEQLGLSLPNSRAAFRAIVDSAQAAGDSNLFATLMQLAPAFNDLAAAAEQLLSSGSSVADVASEVKNFVSSVDSSLTILKDTIDRELKTALDQLQSGYDALIKTLELQKQTADAAKSVAEESLTAINSVFDVIKEQVSSILGEVLPAQTAAQGSAFISDALLAAQTTGYLPDSNTLNSAIAAARTGLGAKNFSTELEMKMANMRLVAQLTGIQDIAGEQKTVAELQLEVATKQLESIDSQIEQAKTQYDSDVAATQAYYDNQLQMAQNQVNELRGINSSVITMTQALSAFGAAINAERVAANPNNNRIAAISQMYIDILRRAPEAAGLEFWDSSGKSLDEIRSGIANSIEARGYAEGGRYPGGLAMVGERGPELINFANPGMVYTAAQTQSLLGGAGGAEVANELRSLREENKVQARSIVQLNLRMTRVLERWDGDGMPMERVETV